MAKPKTPFFVQMPETAEAAVDELLLFFDPKACVKVERAYDTVGNRWYHESGGDKTAEFAERCGFASGAVSFSVVAHPLSRPLFRPFTVLREPSARAVAALERHLFPRGRLGGSLSDGALTYLSPTRCYHDFRICADLRDASQCRLKGSCGLFQNAVASSLAAPHGRPARQVVRLATNESHFLRTALDALDATEVVGIVEHWTETACLVAAAVGLPDLKGCCSSPSSRECPAFALRDDSSSTSHKEPKVSAALLSYAARGNALDRRVYEAGYARFFAAAARGARPTGPPLPSEAPLARVFAGDEAALLEAAAADAAAAGARPKSVWGKAFVADATRTPSVDDPSAVRPVGLVVFAAGEADLQRAMKAASSARAACPDLRGSPLHATLVADGVGHKCGGSRSLQSLRVLSDLKLRQQGEQGPLSSRDLETSSRPKL